MQAGQGVSQARRRVTLDRPPVRLDVIVEGDGPAVVLLPSLGRDSEDYDDVASGIAARGFTVLRPQPRGLGGSTGPMTGLTLRDLAGDIREVIVALGGGSAVIVGHAFGNWVARMTASLFPGIVRGVVIAAAAAKQYPPHLTENIRRIAAPGTPPDERLRLLQETFFAAGNDASVWLDGWHEEVRASQLAANRATPQSEWWGAGGVRLLDLQAEDDPFKPPAKRGELRDELGDRVSITVIPRASHALLPEQPGAVVDAVCTWAASLPGVMRRATITAFGRGLSLRAEAIPEPAGREVLVRVRHCGVCHTDLHLRHGYYELGAGKRWHFAERGLLPPITPGHEIYGEITRAGEDAQEAVGRVGVVFPWIGCGQCGRCGAGQEQDCARPRFLGFRSPGGFGDYVLLPDPRYLLDVSGIEPAIAASLACAGLTAFSALRKLEPDPEAPLLIIGAGGLGLAAIGLARRLGFDDIVVLEPHPGRRDAALEAGASRAVAPPELDAGALGGSLSGVIDFVGRPETFELGTSLLRRNGRYVLVGLFGGEVTLTLPMVALRAITIMGSAVGSLSEMRILIDLVRTSSMPRAPTRSVTLDRADEALDELERGDVVGRLVLTPG